MVGNAPSVGGAGRRAGKHASAGKSKQFMLRVAFRGLTFVSMYSRCSSSLLLQGYLLHLPEGVRRVSSSTTR